MKKEYVAPEIVFVKVAVEKGYCVSMAEENRMFEANSVDESNTASSYSETGWTWDW